MKTVFVGLSGGVDSAVSAALLQQQGYAVVGAFIKIWRPEFAECPWREERLDAMRVAAALGVPFREVDLSDEYKRNVIDDMIAKYEQGLTPNPDVLCNRHIKFGSFAAWAFAQGADYIATGHYARTSRINGRTTLMRGADPAKDQSYFLNRLTEHDLERVLFPVGGMRKEAVRAQAQALNLPIARKPDSQGLCFVGAVDMADFLKQIIPVEPGDVLDESGSIIGRHEGAALYTIGMRHGFTTNARTPQEKARYVTHIDTAHNTITTSSDSMHGARADVPLIDVSWVHDEPKDGAVFQVQTRYREAPAAAVLHTRGGVHIVFSEPHRAPPGQSLVMYDGEQLIGSGIIAP